MKFREEDLLHEKLKEYFGFSSFKGNQEAVIRNVLAGRDTFVLMPTGGGKSLCYQLPALIMDGVAIVISPLIALMKNQVDAMRTFSTESGIAHFLNSSLNKSAIAQVRQDVLEGRTKLLYFAPESLTKEDNIAFLRKIKISFYAIDEAHCISEWGHDFRPEYRRIRPIINDIGPAPLIALTATATPKVQMDIQKNLGMADAILAHLAAKLPVSRLQRDLTDSTVLRNVGVPLAHTLIAFASTLKGLGKLLLHRESIDADLEAAWAVVAEGIQTILRREGYPNPYETLKALTRTNEAVTAESISAFIDTLEVSEDVRAELHALSPSTYTGF